MYDWQMSIDKTVGSSGNGHNKVRFYRQLKRFYGVEHYCKETIPRLHRAAFAFRCGAAPLKIETGRYRNLLLTKWYVHFVLTYTEDKTHANLHCPAYEDLKRDLFDKVKYNYCNTFTQLGDKDACKICVLFSTEYLVRNVANTCFYILRTRISLLYK